MTSDTANFQTLIDKGHSAVWSQDWHGAVDAYSQALSENPDDPMALSSLGLAYFQLKNYEEALRVFQRLTILMPDDPMPFERISRIYERVGMLNEAIKCYLHTAEFQLKARDVDRAVDNYYDVIRLDPLNQAAHTRLAKVFDRMGRKKEAVAEFIALAAILQNSGDPVKALQVVSLAQQISPDSIEARNAVTQLKSGGSLTLPERKRGGTGPVRMAQVRDMEIAPSSSEPDVNYDPFTEAKLAALKELAGLLFEQSEDSHPAGRASHRSIHVLTRGTGELSSEQSDRKRIQLHLSQAIDLQTSGQDDRSAVELERALDLGLNQSAAYYLAGLLCKEEDPQKSLKYLQRSVRNPAYSLASYLMIGQIYEKSGQLKEASVNFLQALKYADATTVPAREAEEIMQLYDPIFESSLQVSQEKDLINLCNVINSQLTRSDWRAYLKAARAQLPSQPAGSPPLPLAEMLMESTSGQVVESLSMIKKLASEGKLRTAMEEAYDAVSYAPTYLPLHIQMGEILITEGRITEAVEKFLLVSRLYTIRGETAQAIRLLYRVTKLASMDFSIRHSLINLLKSIGRNDDAIQQYMELAQVHYTLGELDETRDTYANALSLSHQSSTARDWSVKILNKLADIELQSLNWKDAIKVFEQLRSLQPLDASPRTMLIDLYLRLGLIPAAMNELDAYLKLLGNENQSSLAEKFLDDLLKERPDNSDLQKRMAGYFILRDEPTKAVEKLDALAERLLNEDNVQGAISTVGQIIALNPPNRADYERLSTELKSRNLN